MKRFRPWVAGVGLCVVVAPAAAVDVLLDFEGVRHSAEVFEFYRGVYTDSSVTKTGTDFSSSLLTTPVSSTSPNGAVFSLTAPAEALAYRNLFDPVPNLFGFVANDGKRITAPAVHPLASALNEVVMGSGATAGLYSEMSFAAGFELSSLSFWYSSQQVGSVVAFAANGNVIHTFDISIQSRGESIGTDGLPKTVCGNDGEPLFCNWTQVSGGATATAYSLRFYNDGSTNTVTLYDNIQFSTAAVVPEPSTYALMALGLAGIALMSRRRRES